MLGLLIPSAIAVPVVLNAQAPIWIWATGFSGSADVHMLDIASSSSNGAFAHGSFGIDIHLPFDTLTASNGHYFIAHVDTLGYVTWAVQFSNEIVSMHGTADGGVSCLVSYTGSTIVNGESYGSAGDGHSLLLVEIDGAGTVAGALNIPDVVALDHDPVFHHTPESGIALLVAYDDSISIIGQWVHDSGIALARISSLGELLWAQRLGSGTIMPGCLNVDQQGRSLVAVLWGYALLPTDTVFVNGESTVASYGPSGNYEWREDELFYDMFDHPLLRRRANGNALISLSLPALEFGFIASHEFDASGTNLWSNQATGITGLFGHRPSSMVPLVDGGTLLGGYKVGPLTFGTINPGHSGPDLFVSMIDDQGDWQWAVTESSGNVFGPVSSLGNNTRIYSTGTTDTGVSFGDHVVPTSMGDFKGFVACLGDATLSNSDGVTLNSTLSARPNPAENVLQISLPINRTHLMIVTDIRGRTMTDHIRRLSPSSFDVSRLSPGTYVLSLGEQHVRFIKE
ncbi:MAG: T9SS type A sorting domain-containing protein [Flavobacteriales bacterium]|nr:T9SS type A sorting domain-containing protein [Flavobacteriales bacterium]